MPVADTAVIHVFPCPSELPKSAVSSVPGRVPTTAPSASGT